MIQRQYVCHHFHSPPPPQPHTSDEEEVDAKGRLKEKRRAPGTGPEDYGNFGESSRKKPSSRSPTVSPGPSSGASTPRRTKTKELLSPQRSAQVPDSGLAHFVLQVPVDEHGSVVSSDKKFVAGGGGLQGNRVFSRASTSEKCSQSIVVSHPHALFVRRHIASVT